MYLPASRTLVTLTLTLIFLSFTFSSFLKPSLTLIRSAQFLSPKSSLLLVVFLMSNYNSLFERLVFIIRIIWIRAFRVQGRSNSSTNLSTKLSFPNIIADFKVDLGKGRDRAFFEKQRTQRGSWRKKDVLT